MVFPISGGGYQVDDGNVNEIDLWQFPTPANTATTTATLTVQQLTGNLLVANPGASAASYTLPTVAQLEAVIINPKPGATFEFKMVNLGTASGVITIVAGTGWTLTGLVTTAITSSSQWLAQCQAQGSWTLFRI